MKEIQQFSDEYEFLSNFYFCKIKYDGLEYLSAESAYQAQKTLDSERRKDFQLYLASRAKRHGRKLKLRPDWEQVKDRIMYEIVLAKFTQDEQLRIALLNTGDAHYGKTDKYSPALRCYLFHLRKKPYSGRHVPRRDTRP